MRGTEPGGGTTRGFGAGKPKAVLLDMDGVLFDSMPYHARAWMQACRERGLPIEPDEPFLHEGRTGGSTIDIFANKYWGRNATEEEKAGIYARKCAAFNAFPEVRRMPGAALLLSKLKAQGVVIGVVTGSGQESLLSRLGNGYGGFFRKEHVVSGNDTERGKPAPDPYLKGLEKCGVRADEALAVENAPLGVRAAVAAGILTVAVNTGPLDPQLLSREGASLVFPSMQALAEAWPEEWQDTL